MTYYAFDLELTLEAPFLIAGSRPAGFGVDISQIRDFNQCPIIPDTHIKGVLRHAWELFSLGDLDSGQSGEVLFGGDGGDTGDSQGRVSFTDLTQVCDGDNDNMTRPAIVTRVSIDDATGAAVEGSLVTVEMVAPAGERRVFSGSFTAFCETMDAACALGRDVAMVLGAVEATGRFKTVGFGRVMGVGIAPPRALGAVKLTNIPGNNTGVQLTFQLNKRLLVDTKLLDKNTHEGAGIIPGGALKGALARSFELAGQAPRSGDLGRVLSQMIFSHAVPFAPPSSGQSGPLSGADSLDLVRIGNAGPQRWPPAHKINFEKSLSLAQFQPDWKDAPASDLQRDVRTRVAIERDTGAAKDGALFSQSAVSHVVRTNPASKVKPIEWRGSIRWPGPAGGADHALFLDCVRALQQGLFSLGKTNAQTVDLRLTPLARPYPPLPEAQTFVVTLLSPALMIRERHLASEDLYALALNLYWRTVSQGCLSIAQEENEDIYETPDICGPALDFYCHQEFRSGYTALRFPYFGANRLEPFTLSTPGSVFVLRASDKVKAATVLTQLCRTGLPIGRWSDETDGLGKITPDPAPDFRACPFGPQNGYGAISVAQKEGEQ